MAGTRTGTRAHVRAGAGAWAGAWALFVLSVGTFAALCAAQRFEMADVLVYRAEGSAVLHGTDLYGFTVTEWRLPATYPPFAALLFVPTALVPLGALKVAFLLVNLALLAVLVQLSLRLLPAPHRTGAGTGAGVGAGVGRVPLVVGGTALALWLEPVFQTLVFGQINLALACLVLWDLTRPDGARGKGFALGVATGIKLTPALFALYLLLTGRVRAGLTAVAGFAVTVGVGALVLPGASLEFWGRRIFETTRVGKAWIVDNQSLQGLVARLAHTTEPGPLWLVPGAVAAGCGLLLARCAYVRGDPGRPHGHPHGPPHAAGWGEVWGVLVTALVTLLVSPISWTHHWVWCVPLLAALAVRAPRGVTVALGVVFTARTMWLLPRAGDLDLRLPWWQQPLASPYPLLALGLLAYGLWRFGLPYVRGEAGAGIEYGRARTE